MLKMKKKILVSFSGGLDSVYMTYKLLEEGHNIFPVYFELKDSNISKVFTEKQQADKIITMFRNDFPNQISKMSVVSILFKDSQWDSWGAGVKAFIFNNRFISEVAFGINQSDLYSEKDLEKFRNRVIKFKREFKKIKVTLPIFNLNKIEIYSLLPKKYINETFSCEFPIYEKNGNWISRECGICKPCSIKKMMGIFTTIKFDLNNQPSDEFAIDNNTEHRMHVASLNLNIKLDPPMHMNTNEIYKLN